MTLTQNLIKTSDPLPLLIIVTQIIKGNPIFIRYTDLVPLLERIPLNLSEVEKTEKGHEVLP